MSGKSRHAVRMSNLLEKSNHIKLESIDDPTLVNYMALYTAIIDKEPSNDMRKYLPRELFDREEGDTRMKKLDEDKAKGKLSEEQMRTLSADNKKYEDIVRKKIEQYKKRMNTKQTRNMKPIKVTNKYAGTEEIFPSIKEFADEYGYKSRAVSGAFSYHKSKSIKFRGLILEKL